MHTNGQRQPNSKRFRAAASALGTHAASVSIAIGALTLTTILGGCATQGTSARAPERQLVVIGSANRAGSGTGYMGSVLTQDELRNCISLDRQYCALYATIGGDSTGRSLDQERQSIEAEGKALDAAGPGVNRYSQAAVDAYNVRIRAHSSRINAYNMRVASHSGQVNALNGVADRFNAACVGKAFYADDLQAVSPGWTQCPGATAGRP